MENIAKKLQLLNCPANMYQRAYKHIASLETVSLEELEQILRLLLTKKIIIPKNGEILVAPEDFCVFANGFDILKTRIEEMENAAKDLDAYKEKLIRINSKSAINNIIAMNKMGEPYKTPEGKYSKIPFSVRRFQNKYGILAEKKFEKPTEDISSKQIVKTEKNPEVPLMESVFTSILNSPQEEALTDESFEKFERLTDSLQRIMFTVYGVNEVNDQITENLIKLITSKNSLLESQEADTNIDAELLYNAITYGKTIDDLEKQRIIDTISEELQYAKDNDIELGRAA